MCVHLFVCVCVYVCVCVCACAFVLEYKPAKLPVIRRKIFNIYMPEACIYFELFYADFYFMITLIRKR